MKIYDILGNIIVKLVNEIQEQGNHHVEWNASDYSSGIYYYKLTSGNFSKTKKLVLIK